MSDVAYAELERAVGEIINAGQGVASRADVEAWAQKKILHGIQADTGHKKPAQAGDKKHPPAQAGDKA